MKLHSKNKQPALCFLLVIWLPVILITPLTAQRRGLPKAIVLTHVTIVNVSSGQLSRDQNIVIEGERITKIGDAHKVIIPAGAQVIDASGKYVIPGLWDAHVHLSYLGACALPVFVANGVTSVRDAGARLEEIAAWQKQIREGKLVGPRIRQSGPDLESTEWLERARKVLPATDEAWQLGPRREVSGPEQAASVVDSLARLGVDFVKFRNLQRPSFMAVMAEAKRLNLPVAGHAPKGTSLAEASEAGMKSIEHAETVMLALGSLTREERLRSFQVLAKNGTLITPTLNTDIAAHLTPDSEALAIIEDSSTVRDVRRKYVSARPLRLWRHGLELKKQYDEGVTDWRPQYERELEDMRLAHRAGVRFMAGTDVGGIVGIYPGFSVHDELGLLVKEMGLTPLEALQSATQNPPAFFNDQNQFGAIESGRIADLVLLDENPLDDIRHTRQIRTVILGGKVLQRADLDALLADVATGIMNHSGCAAGD